MLARRSLLVVCLALLAFGSVGCGQLTIRTWVTVIEDESTGSVDVVFLGQPAHLGLSRLQGGFLTKVQLNTQQIASGPLNGTIELEDLRIAGQGEGALGTFCTWGDPTLASGGTVVLDILGGTPGSAELTLNLKAFSGIQQAFGLPPATISQATTLPLGAGLTLETLLAAQASGSADGLFATETSFTGSTSLGGIPATFNLNLAVTNFSEPPVFDADHLAFCGTRFDEQGADLFFGLNSKSTYLRVREDDTAQAPLIIRLSEIGAAPGDVLHLAPVGTYSDATLLKDGSDKRLTAVFSSTTTLRAPGERNRVAGAINAGSDVLTSTYFECFLIFCALHNSDISQDFRIDPSVNVTVPTGAQYLFVAPTPSSQKWGDNSGFGFGVSVEVN